MFVLLEDIVLIRHVYYTTVLPPVLRVSPTGHFIAKDQLPACGDAGCPAVLGIMLELTMDESEVKPELRRIIEAMPLIEKQSATINGSLNLNNIIPDNRTYFVYEVRISNALLLQRFCIEVVYIIPVKDVLDR